MTDAPVREGLHGLSEERVQALFRARLRVERVAHGTTTNAKGQVVPSAWFWLTRRAGG